VGLVHGHVCPATIFLSTDGVRLLGLGVFAWEPDDLSDPRRLAALPSHIPANFFSPEMAAGKPTDPRSDLFSLGAVMFLCVTGTLPFDAPTRQGVVERLRSDAPAPDLTAARPPTAISPAFYRIVAKALSFKPEQRYESAAAMLAVLEALPPP